MRMNVRRDLRGALPMSLIAGAAYPVVRPEEIAFAMTLFLQAASLQLASRRCGDGRDSDDCECVRVLRELAGGIPLAAPKVLIAAQESSLEGAFAALWHHYEGEPVQLSLSARVLGFHLLALNNGGRILERWVRENVAGTETVTLDPALVEALAVVPLGDTGRLDAELFFATAELLAGL
ncbi:hypothetical protein [Granulicella tundricola]|uniref:Uncharacterized protein n=1 Tax=Granulicella tundricola (strain ATCC BAA-1859 / DSM 23138 / MP5ACTX9) TaxID=1198114 RepID=E8X5I1_GRATM|nr:hypothetical protein [Granulicella tundricola]ADW69528.1 hypothetical protein AciX9_2496 [Granulicella tundricola MP5ACTX9]